ncbi:MAG: NifB/NifX family molybdenum-iron cluster-binding protein [Chloroflexota bacterium]
MKLLISVTSPELDAQVDPRFGRAAHFLVVEPETLEWSAFPNPALNAAGGAGIQAAQFVTAQKCQAVVSGAFGPNAYDAFDAAGIPMYLFGSCRTAREVIERFKSGQLEQAVTPGEAGHSRR